MKRVSHICPALFVALCCAGVALACPPSPSKPVGVIDLRAEQWDAGNFGTYNFQRNPNTNGTLRDIASGNQYWLARGTTSIGILRGAAHNGHDAVAGDALGAATDALLGEIADFFPKGRREILQRILGKLTALQNKATSLALLKLDDPALDQQMEAELKAAIDLATAFAPAGPTSSTSGAGNSPESPASSPEATPSAS